MRVTLGLRENRESPLAWESEAETVAGRFPPHSLAPHRGEKPPPLGKDGGTPSLPWPRLLSTTSHSSSDEPLAPVASLESLLSEAGRTRQRHAKPRTVLSELSERLLTRGWDRSPALRQLTWAPTPDLSVCIASLPLRCARYTWGGFCVCICPGNRTSGLERVL